MSDTMARKPKLPWKRRVQDVIADLFGDKSPIRVPDAVDLPSSINKRNNAEVKAFHDEHDVIAEYALAYTAKQAAEMWVKTTRVKMCEILNIEEDRLEPGLELAYTRDNVSVLVKVNQQQRRLDREMLRAVLMLELKLSAERVDELIKKGEKLSKAPLFLTPTVND